jgi:hypothetical protein
MFKDSDMTINTITCNHVFQLMIGYHLAIHHSEKFNQAVDKLEYHNKSNTNNIIASDCHFILPPFCPP